MLSKQDVEHIANLARIELDESEKKKYQKQLGKILDYFEKLKEVDTKNALTADGGTMNLENVWREDEQSTINNQQSTINNQQSTINLIDMAPEKEMGQVRVKSVF